MIKLIKNKKGVGIIEAIFLVSIFFFMPGCYFDTMQQNNKRDEMVAKYSPNELYKNKFSEIKPLSTKDYVVKVENSEIENEKYIKMRFSVDNFEMENIYVVQKRDDDSFEVIRKKEKLNLWGDNL